MRIKKDLVNIVDMTICTGLPNEMSIIFFFNQILPDSTSTDTLYILGQYTPPLFTVDLVQLCAKYKGICTIMIDPKR